MDHTRTDDRIRQVQAYAEQVLAACTRVLVPVPGWPRRGCFACGRVPDARVSMRLDGEEVFWADVCELHHDETYEVSVSSAARPGRTGT